MTGNFRTEIQLPAYPFRIDHHQGICCMGSCFAEHIAARLAEGKFKVGLNPYGIVYNPVSLAKTIVDLVNGKKFGPEDVFQHNELWHSFDHHGAFSFPTQEQTLESINTTAGKGSDALRNANLLILTLGTAHLFEHRASNRIVANCHKLPGQDFERRRLPVEAVIDVLSKAITEARMVNPSLRVLLTVSPVRHLRDGMVENQRSKATLLLAAATLCEQLSNTWYFPAYEMVIDDLRDYRFFEPDMIHPNSLAIDYIWEHFSQSFFEDSTQQLLQRIRKITQAAQHRPFHRETEAHRVFLQQQQEAIEALQREFPFLEF